MTDEEKKQEEQSDLPDSNVNNESFEESVLVQIDSEEVALGSGVEKGNESDFALNGGKIASTQLPYTKGGTPMKYPYILGGALMVLIGLATKVSVKKNK